MRKPTRPECLYVDFDGFFASCESRPIPRLPRLSCWSHTVSRCA